VHATQCVRAGEEVCFNYLRFMRPRAARQRELREHFGFECACVLCRAPDVVGRDSDARIAAIGDDVSLRDALRARSSLEHLVLTMPAQTLSWMGALDMKIAEEAGEGVFHRTQAFLQAFVEYCDAAYHRLMRLACCDDSSRHSDTSISISRPDGSHGQMRVPRTVLRSRARAYGEAARMWAAKAMRLARRTEGEDSPTFKVYQAAMRSCWDAEAEMANGDHLDHLTFSHMWVGAGLRPTPLHMRTS
jgi:hypothetical protein